MQFSGAIKGGLDVGLDVFATDMIEEAGVLQEFRGLLHGSAEQECATRVGEALGEGLDGVRACGVDRGHIAQAQDDDGREGLDVRGCVDEFLRCAEEEWAVYAEERHVGWN